MYFNQVYNLLVSLLIFALYSALCLRMISHTSSLTIDKLLSNYIEHLISLLQSSSDWLSLGSRTVHVIVHVSDDVTSI